MGGHTPKPPTVEQLTHILKHWIIMPEKGIIWNKTFNRELGSAQANRTGKIYWIVPINTPKFRLLKRSHLIWWKAKGRWPILELDHIDRNSTNDISTNLKEATPSENQQNSKYGDIRKAVGLV